MYVFQFPDACGSIKVGPSSFAVLKENHEHHTTESELASRRRTHALTCCDTSENWRAAADANRMDMLRHDGYLHGEPPK